MILRQTEKQYFLKKFPFVKLNSKQKYWLDFLSAMTAKEIRASYKNSILGFFWIILNPLIQMSIMGFIFHFFVPVKIDNYFLFLFAGLLPWTFFSSSLTKGTPSIIRERSLIHKSKFPRETIVLSIVLSRFFHLLVAMGLLIILLVADKLFLEGYALYDLLLYMWRMLGTLPLLIWLFTFTSGLVLLTSAIVVKFRDINFIVQALIPLWFYATPIVYTLDLIPASFQILFYLNPLTAIIEGFHSVLFTLSPADGWESVVISLLLTSVVAYMGCWIFNKESKNFSDWI